MLLNGTFWINILGSPAVKKIAELYVTKTIPYSTAWSYDPVTCVLVGNAEGEVIGLGAGVDEEGDGEVPGQGGAQPLSVHHQVVV